MPLFFLIIGMPLVVLDQSDEFAEDVRDIAAINLIDDEKMVIFRVVQECLTNIHRHSGSKTALIRIARDEYGLKVEITDHGKGISPERLAEIQDRGSGVGIRGIRERIRQFNGDIKIQSDGAGTTVLITFPLVEVPVERRSQVGA